MSATIRGGMELDHESPVLQGLRHRVEPGPITVMVADDDLLFAEALAALIGRWEEFSLVGCASSVAETLEMARRHKPHVILMGVNMNGEDGYDVMRSILRERPDTRLMVIVSHSDKNSLFAVLDAGACGVGVREEMSADRLRGQIWGMVGGCIIFSESLMLRMVEERGSERASRPAASQPIPPEPLTKRESEVLALLMEGLSNAEIGRELFLSEPTVKKSVSRIIDKLHVSNRVQAAVFAARYGLC